MGEKDIAERNLIMFADVFADIVNNFLLEDGEEKIKPEDLLDLPGWSVFNSLLHGEARSQVRDAAKLLTLAETIISLIGLENQSQIDPFMPVRVFSYDAGDYKAQLIQRDDEARAARKAGDHERAREIARRKLYPVRTAVLYYGLAPWTGPRTLSECLAKPAVRFKGPENDYEIDVIDVAHLSREQINKLSSDFRVVADYFCQRRTNKGYKPSLQEIIHVHAVLTLLKALTGDHFFEEAAVRLQPKIDAGEVITMASVFDEAIATGVERGILIGEERGEERGRREGKIEGRREGRREGGLNMLFALVDDGLVPLDAALAKANMSEEEFKAQRLKLMGNEE